MKKRAILLPALAGAAGVCGTGAAAQDERPNVVIIYTDDMGYGDIGAYGGHFTPTPNIDRIGKDGIQFNQYYTSCPISSPSRVGMTTGMYPAEWGITTFLNDRKANRKNNSNDYLLAEAPAIARSFQHAGYATAHIGKWHMGGGRDVKDMPQITEYGFDEYISTWESPDPAPELTASNWIWSERDSIKRWERTGYFVDKVLDFLGRNKEKPCYVHLWPDDMHTPYVPSKEEYDKGGAVWNKKVNFIPVLAEFDRQVGRLMSGLEELGIRENTIVIFTSDNGPNPSYKNSRTAGMRGQKGTLYEGGIRMPFLVCWPKKIQAGQINDNTVLTAIDLFPTLCKMADVEPVTNGYTLDGQDLSKAFTGGVQMKRKGAMYWEFGQHFKWDSLPADAYQSRSPHIAVRKGDWKLLVNADGSHVELYDLARDVNETTNVAEENPRIAKKISQMAIRWYSENFRRHAGKLEEIKTNK
ncbi:MAG: sulfatase-like hydrolase/transferase [Clostridium sp.]|nr:sulfatase-like hydrolase/transferase [Bacteroides sp.]MCM1197272.1 sulfatase-like hydrolase/transferase [Clostridium sp.]